MALLLRYCLNGREKDALLSEQAARVKELEALLAKPKKDLAEQPYAVLAGSLRAADAQHQA